MLRTVVRVGVITLGCVALAVAAVVVALARQPDAFAEEDPYG